MSNPGQPLSEEDKWRHELLREDAQRAHDKADDFHGYTDKAAIESAQLALRMLMLINGGAAVALLAFAEKMEAAYRGAIADTLVWFASGVALAVAGIALAYFTNYFMAGRYSSMTRQWQHPFVTDGPKTSSTLA